jgi:hypothetical protein
VSDMYDRDGKPLALFEWAALAGDPEYKRVGYDELNGFDVSTVWLGIDYRFGRGTPLIFETMVFPAGSMSEVYCARYSTMSAAAAGHREVVAWIAATGSAAFTTTD